jgi:hypothetical protein
MTMDEHVILAGQSEALGFENTGPAPYAPTARVQIWTDTDHDGQGDAWNYMLPGVNTGTVANPAVWGAEVEQANRFLAQHPNDGAVLWIVKVARGDTGLAQDSSHGEMFDLATAETNAARHNLDGSPYGFGAWDVLDWMQGETDAQSMAKAGAYGQNVRAFIGAARDAWRVHEVVVGRISGVWGPADANALVRQAQWNLDNGDAPMEGVHTFKTMDFPKLPDGHFDAEGQLQLGTAFAGWLL